MLAGGRQVGEDEGSDRWLAGVGLQACGGRSELGLVVGMTMEVDVGVDGGVGDEIVEVGAAVHNAGTVAHEFGAEFLVAPGCECFLGAEDLEVRMAGTIEAVGFERWRRGVSEDCA